MMTRWPLVLTILTPLLAHGEDPVFVATTASAPPAAGAVIRIDKDWAVTLMSNGMKTTTSGNDLVSLRRSGELLPAFPSGPHVVFANGDRLAGQVMKIERGEVKFKAVLGGNGDSAASQELSIPLSALAVIWFRAPPRDPADEISRGWATERRRRDVVLLNNGDTRIGAVAGMASPTAPFLLKEDSREIRIEASHVVAIAMNTDLARSLRPRGAYARLVLANGSRIGLLSASADTATLSGKTLFAADVKIPLEQIVSLDVRQGKAVYLSDLKPKEYQHSPFLGVRWPLVMDRSSDGRELRLGGHTFDKGIGLHSESRLTFSLGGSYRRFEATVGLDDRSGQGGSVRIGVLVDGQQRIADDKELTSASGPRNLSIDVSGAKELTLVVEFGGGGDVCDHVDWADARVIK
jgi:hypothetical protein